MSGEIFTDSSMLEIFRAEVETHVESLTSGILALERNPGDTSHIDEMMRGAHSIKGAARIVGIDPAVRVAHVMEDGFVAAQHGKLTLRPEHVDVLLRGVDMLNRIANASQTAGIDWMQFDHEATPLVAEIKSVLSGGPTTAPRGSAVSAPASPPSSKGLHPSVIMEPSTSQSRIDEITICLTGVLDAAAAEVARRSFVAGLNANLKTLRFDLSQMTDVDATGIAFLAAVPSQVEDSGLHLVLTGVSADLRSVLEATGIDQLYASEGH